MCLIITFLSVYLLWHDIITTCTHTHDAIMQLCLRAWQDILPSSEFRCFVRRRRLLGVSQRDTHTHYPYLQSLREQLLQEIGVFLSNLHHLISSESCETIIPMYMLVCMYGCVCIICLTCVPLQMYVMSAEGRRLGQQIINITITII